MLISVLKAIGAYFLYFLSGYNIAQCFCHLLLSTYPTKYLEKLKAMSAIFSTHIGNTIFGLSELLISLFILLILKYEFKLNLKTLFIFLGFNLNFIILALGFDQSFFQFDR